MRKSERTAANGQGQKRADTAPDDTAAIATILQGMSEAIMSLANTMQKFCDNQQMLRKEIYGVSNQADAMQRRVDKVADQVDGLAGRDGLATKDDLDAIGRKLDDLDYRMMRAERQVRQ
ncbi:MAG: hypothetical protein IT335_16190 [Thermomicrobiales bacterium]|nr:hypothetical protein [Thermomicrobiales bacterium]